MAKIFKDKEPAVEAEAEAPVEAAPEADAPVVHIFVRANTDLLEPRFKIRLPKGVETPVPEMTEWLKCQVEAGLLVVVG